jgi:hypothetical protein
VEIFTEICEEFIASCLRVEAQRFYRECGHRENLKSHNLEEPEIKMDRKIYGPKREGIISKWMILQNEKLHDLYSPFSTVTIVNPEKFRWSGHVSLMRETRNAHGILVGKHFGTRRRPENNTKFVFSKFNFTMRGGFN